MDDGVEEKLAGVKSRAARASVPGTSGKEQKQPKEQAWLRRFVEPIVAIVLVIAGLILCLIPGPGFPLIMLGAVLLAERSRRVARVLDWTEVKIRRVASWSKKWWRHRSPAAKVAAVFLLAAGCSAAAYGALRTVLE